MGFMRFQKHVSIHTQPHPLSDNRRRIEVGGLFLPVKTEVSDQRRNLMKFIAGFSQRYALINLPQHFLQAYSVGAVNH